MLELCIVYDVHENVQEGCNAELCVKEAKLYWKDTET